MVGGFAVLTTNVGTVIANRSVEGVDSRRRFWQSGSGGIGSVLMVSECASFYVERDHQQRLSPGDLVWGSARGYPAWPGKLVGPVLGSPGLVSVRWFGGGGESQVAARLLKTLSEGLEAHHAARTRGRKSRKLNSRLEKAIQEAMGELDRMTEPQELVHRLRRNIHR
uniref:PWWP domain-containing protein n=1 Tax=Timema douglasi TaxID=61478 RepID=A0A7R8ZG20_TIMDO|nr:unnamed protein product [Timema douglasi]